MTGCCRISRRRRATNATVSKEILAEDEAIVGYEIAINPERMRVVPVEEMFRSVELGGSQ